MSDVAALGKVARSDVVALLSPTLGIEKSTELVTSTASRLGLGSSMAWSKSDTLNVLRTLGAHEGLVGVVARFAIARAESSLFAHLASSPPSVSMGSAPPPPMTSMTPTGGTPSIPSRPKHDTGKHAAIPTMTFVELEALLAPSLGAEKTRATLESAVQRLALGPGPYPRPSAITLIESLEREEGLVGAVARFAHARILLKLPR